MLWDILWRYKNHFSLFFCVSFSFVSIIWHSNTNPFSRSVNYLGILSDRMSGFLNSGLRFTDHVWIEFSEYKELEEKYKKAQKTIEEHRLERDKLDILRLENERLRSILEFSAETENSTVRAEVLGVRLNSISPRIIINKGKSDGIRPFMPVYTQAHDSEKNIIRAIVGIAAFVGETVTVVQPVLHPDFQMGVRIPRTGHWAIISGNSGKKGRLILKDISMDTRYQNIYRNQSRLEYPDNIVLTSGEGGVFPKGIPVGILEKKLSELGESDTVYVLPLAPIGKLDIVHVVLKTPEKWSGNWVGEIDWDEHLRTEFGSPQYPESLSQTKTKKNYRETVRKKELKKEDAEKEIEPESGVRQERRRLNNLPQAVN